MYSVERFVLTFPSEFLRSVRMALRDSFELSGACSLESELKVEVVSWIGHDVEAQSRRSSNL